MDRFFVVLPISGLFALFASHAEDPDTGVGLEALSDAELRTHREDKVEALRQQMSETQEAVRKVRRGEMEQEEFEVRWEAVQRQQQALGEKIRAMRAEAARRRALSEDEEKGMLVMPAFPARLAWMQDRLDTIDAGAPWATNPEMTDREFVASWIGWQKETEPQWREIQRLRVPTDAVDLDQVFEDNPDSSRQAFLEEAKRIEDQDGSHSVILALRDPESRLSQLKGQMHEEHRVQSVRRHVQKFEAETVEREQGVSLEPEGTESTGSQ